MTWGCIKPILTFTGFCMLRLLFLGLFFLTTFSLLAEDLKLELITVARGNGRGFGGHAALKMNDKVYSFHAIDADLVLRIFDFKFKYLLF